MSVFVKEVARGRGGIVAAQSRRAAAAGVDVLRAGGNAVDATVATSLALGVCEPWMSGIGGGCAALIKPAAGDPVAVNGAMRAPLALDPSAYPLTGATGTNPFLWPEVMDDRNVRGPLAAAVPGLVAALGLAHERFGRLPWAEVVAPATAIADAGHEVDWYTTLIIASAAPALRDAPAAAAHFLRDGLPPSPDWRVARITLDTAPLARTYRHLAEAGAEAFYRGDLADLWIEEARAAGTWLRRDDLDAYRAHWCEPRRFTYRDARVTAMNGLFAGSSLEAALGDVARAWRGGDIEPDAYLAYARALDMAYATRLREVGHAADPGNTTHFCIVDADGMIVSWTQTLLSLFGSHVLLPASGILLNNGIMWFDPRPGTPNAIAAGAQPLANMCPALVALGDGGEVALGACGGRRILASVLQLVSFLVDAGDDLGRAFARPRIDVSGPGVATVDAQLERRVAEALDQVLTTSLAAETVYPTNFAIPSAVHVDATGFRTGTSAACHPWSGALAA